MVVNLILKTEFYKYVEVLMVNMAQQQESSLNDKEIKFFISVVIPVYNALEDVKLCIDSVVKNFDFTNGEVILVNDKSNEETTDYLNSVVEKYSNFLLLSNSENLGFVKTCNKGIKQSKGDIVVLLNSDTKIPKGFNEKISNCFKSDDMIGVASPIASSSWLFNIPIKKNYSIDKMNSEIQRLNVAKYPLIPSAEGFCFCIRRSVIKAIGGLDELYGRGYHEEVDFSYRAINAGFKVVLIDDLYVFHKAHASFGKKAGDKLVKQNNKIFRERWGNFRQEYEEKIGFVNPVYELRRKLYPFKYWLFSKEKTTSAKIIKICGIPLKFPKK